MEICFERSVHCLFCSCAVAVQLKLYDLLLGVIKLTITKSNESYSLLEQSKRIVKPAELFGTDPVTLNVGAGEYVCVEIVFSGDVIPYHEESIIPSFVFDNGKWIASKKHPFVSMVGIKENSKKKIAFLGDSITQGIGTDINSYEHWNAILAKLLGNEYSFWNLGLGYGRADDAASDGIWLYKAKQNDIVFVCFGVNDILQGYSADDIKKNLQTIVEKLHEVGVHVIIQTVPPFNYSEEQRRIWDSVNEFIKNDLTDADLIFDCVTCLAKSDDEPHMVKYDPHPDAEGCKVWAEALFAAVRDAIKIFKI